MQPIYLKFILFTDKNTENNSDDSKRRKTMDGRTAGLQSLQTLKEEEEAFKKKELEALKVS